MSDLNVTDGEWVVVDNGDGSASVQFNEDGEHIVDYVYNKNDAYLIAQAKNMYEMIDSLSTELLHMIRKENARLIQNASCIDLDEPDYLDEESVYLARKLMDACKPPEEDNDE